MIYLSKAEDVSKAFSELGSTAAELHSAIVKEYLVDIRLENENPSMDTVFQTQILEANLDVDEKCLNLRFTDSKPGRIDQILLRRIPRRIPIRDTQQVLFFLQGQISISDNYHTFCIVSHGSKVPSYFTGAGTF